MGVALDVENRRRALTMVAMAAAQDTPGRAEPVERFRPTSGQVVGHLTLGAIAVLLVYLAISTHTVNGLRVGTGLVLFGVLVWAVLLRPRATAYPDELHILNSFRDVLIPYTAIDAVTVGRVLSVWVGDERYVCTGIGRPLRKVVPGRRGGLASLLGLGRTAEGTGKGDGEGAAETQDSTISYADFVQNRITSLVEDAERRTASARGTTDALPRHVWAWPELVGVLGSGTAFVLSLLLG